MPCHTKQSLLAAGQLLLSGQAGCTLQLGYTSRRPVCTLFVVQLRDLRLLADKAQVPCYLHRPFRPGHPAALHFPHRPGSCSCNYVR